MRFFAHCHSRNCSWRGLWAAGTDPKLYIAAEDVPGSAGSALLLQWVSTEGMPPHLCSWENCSSDKMENDANCNTPRRQYYEHSYSLSHILSQPFNCAPAALLCCVTGSTALVPCPSHSSSTSPAAGPQARGAARCINELFPPTQLLLCSIHSRSVTLSTEWHGQSPLPPQHLLKPSAV